MFEYPGSTNFSLGSKYLCSYVESLFCFCALYSDELANTKSAMVAKDAESDEKNTTIAQVCMILRSIKFLLNKYSSYFILFVEVDFYPTVDL